MRPLPLPHDAIQTNQQVGAISNRSLAHALLDIYLGTDPASKGAKDSFGQGLAAMVV